MDTLILIVHVFVAIFLILIVLLQSGRGGGMGATFGGASQQIFGGRGAGSFLARLTTGSAIIFFLTSLTLSMMSSRERSVLEKEIEKKQAQAEQEKAEENTNEAGEVGETPSLGEDDQDKDSEGTDSEKPTSKDAPELIPKPEPGKEPPTQAEEAE